MCKLKIYFVRRELKKIKSKKYGKVEGFINTILCTGKGINT